MAEKYHQDSTALAEHLATQRTIASSEASAAVLQSVITHHMDTTDLERAGIIDSATGHIKPRFKPRSEWPEDTRENWKNWVLLQENGQALADVYDGISGDYEDGEDMLWKDKK